MRLADTSALFESLNSRYRFSAMTLFRKPSSPVPATPAAAAPLGTGEVSTRGGCAPRCAPTVVDDPIVVAPPDGEETTPSETRVHLRARTVSRTTDASLRVVTDEGDVVTLTMHEEKQVTYGRLAVRSSGPDGETSAKLRFREFSLARDVSVSVEGDLSEQELADLDALMKQLRPVMSGRPDAEAAEQASHLLERGGFESLERFDLTVQRRREVFNVDLRARVRGAWEMAFGPSRGVSAAGHELDGAPQSLPVTATA
ncbi:MAG: hypothetical protein HOP12_15575 [Candidatus Eisenbacteria bacterium]|uniref:Uncharacterized protein n=1 Tax=Eiseniibacteriota bacterium TaxID=2212470 RepID=A0A849SSC2_UNCEI|nr:hypothetical protein [Candidatus Eisenbacteria bacterium]